MSTILSKLFPMVNTAIKSDRPIEPNASGQFSSFKQQLENIVTKIQINSDFSITHPDYPSVLVCEQYQNYLEQMSQIERDRYIKLKLQKYLYGIFMDRIEPLKSTGYISNDSQPGIKPEIKPEEMINCGDRWYETEFFQKLTQCNHGQGYNDPNWLIVGQAGEYWQVSQDGLTIYIHPQHLCDRTSKLQLGQTVSIKKPSSLIDRGIYIAVGDAGSVSDRQCSLEQMILQLYLNTDSKIALKILDCLTRKLNNLEISFDFKIAYREADFKYSDAATLEFMAQDWLKIQPIIQDIYQQYQPEFKSKIPFFCRQIATGIGLAEKPVLLLDSEVKNLGYWYCEIIAEAIIEMFNKSKKSSSKINNMNYVLNYLSDKNIIIEFFYLNYGSEKYYSSTFL